MQQMIELGLLTNGSHNLSFAHQSQHIEQLLAGYEQVLPQATALLQQGELQSALRCKPLQPIFKVR